MGMDVYGIRPQSATGTYFRNNVWYWHPLWDFCCFIAPDITSKVQEGHSNSGDGLNNFDSRQLGLKLNESLQDGSADEYIRLFEEKKNPPKVACICFSQDNAPNDNCMWCKGEGICDNPGLMYYLDRDNITNFSRFLMECGGFQIL